MKSTSLIVVHSIPFCNIPSFHGVIGGARSSQEIQICLPQTVKQHYKRRANMNKIGVMIYTSLYAGILYTV